MDVIESSSGLPFATVDFAVPEVFVGGLFGAMLVFAFSGLAIQARLAPSLTLGPTQTDRPYRQAEAHTPSLFFFGDQPLSIPRPLGFASRPTSACRIACLLACVSTGSHGPRARPIEPRLRSGAQSSCLSLPLMERLGLSGLLDRSTQVKLCAVL